MVIDTILVENTVGETRAALLSGGVVVEVHHRRPTDRLLPGAVFRGHVRKIDKGLNAAFVDIGEARDGFLRARDAARTPGSGAPRIERLIAEGAKVSVAVVTAPAAGKGARLRLADEGHGDAVGLVQQAPSLVGDVLDSFMDKSVGVVRADGAAALADVRGWFDGHPGFTAEVETADPATLFEAQGVDAVIDMALQHRVPVPGGGSVAFDRTEALHVVDVDSDGRVNVAGRSGLDLNMAAMTVIGQQLRLRNLGGGIVIDAVRMTREADRQAVVGTLREVVADDPAATKVFGVSAMGLVEVSRQRRGLSLAEYLRGDGAAETAAYGALRMALRSVRPQLGTRWRLRCAEDIAATLTGPLAASLETVAGGLGVDLKVEGDPERVPENSEVVSA